MEKDIIYPTKIAVVTAGNVDSGKSSFIGVLITGKLDDGAGSARAHVAVHKHEIEVGRTSAISTRAIVCGNQAITFVDVAGHEKYLGTTAFAFSARFPDYGILIISPANGITKMTKEHLALLVSFNIPILVVITHTDSVPQHKYEMELRNVELLLKHNAGKNIIVHTINNWADQELFNRTDLSEIEKQSVVDKKAGAVNIILKGLMNPTNGKQNDYPILSISNKTGFYIDVIQSVLAKLEPRQLWDSGIKAGESSTAQTNIVDNKIVKYFKSKIRDPTTLPEQKRFSGTVFYIDKDFSVTGIGLVVSGIVRGEDITTKSDLYMGPFGKEFRRIKVRSMQNDLRQDITVMDDHYRGCIAIRSKDEEITRDQLRKGMLIVSGNLIDKICFHFDAEIMLYTKSLTLKAGYTPVIHSGTIRQPARVTKIHDNSSVEEVDETSATSSEVVSTVTDKKNVTTTLKSGEVGVVEFKFKQRPEFIEPYNLFAFRSGDIQGIGMALGTCKIIDDSDAKPDQTKVKKHRKIFKKPIGTIKKPTIVVA